MLFFLRLNPGTFLSFPLAILQSRRGGILFSGLNVKREYLGLNKLDVNGNSNCNPFYFSNMSFPNGTKIQQVKGGYHLN